jgi:hypothetical protein
MSFRVLSFFNLLPKLDISQVFEIAVQSSESPSWRPTPRNVKAIKIGESRAKRIEVGAGGRHLECAYRTIEGTLSDGGYEGGFFLSDPPAFRMLVLFAPLESDIAKSLFDQARLISAHGELGYGYQFLADTDSSPVFRSAGITESRTDGPDSPEAKRDKLWFCERTIGFGPDRIRRFIDSGMIRSIFPVNYLNSSHLEIRIGPKSLVEMIQYLHLGSVEPIGRRNFVWTIDANLIQEAQRSLSAYCISK